MKSPTIWLTDSRYSKYVAAGTILFDAVLTAAIIIKVPYWRTYLQQVAKVKAGERLYSNIYGDTGPLVYPATHVWIYWLLDKATGGGNVTAAQWIFAVLYLVTLALTLLVYMRAQVPPYVLPFLSLSKRLHSIYLLRLFNDPFTTLSVLLATLSIQHGFYLTSATLLSIAVSIKMNALLLLPGAAYIYWHALGIRKSITHVGPAFIVPQLITAAPFIQTETTLQSYLSQAFDFSRKFLYEWTVNFRFLKESTFASQELAIGLLVLHASLLLIFAVRKWPPRPSSPLGPNKCLLILSTSNLIGVLCSRSLHYQFYSWFYWSVPYLLWHPFRRKGVTAMLGISVVVLVLQEYAWNKFPSTNLSSGLVVFSAAFTLLLNLI